MEFSDRIRAAIAGSGKTQAQIAKEAGISQGAISQYLSGHVKSLKAGTAAKLSEATGYAATWLATGEGPEKSIADLEGKGARASLVPLISWVQAGEWTSVVSTFDPADADMWLPCPTRHSPDAFALRVRGDSMHNPGREPSFKDGDIIFVDPRLEAHHRSLVVVRLDDGSEATFKQLLTEGNERFLQALNPDWPNRIFPINGKASLCGVVIGKYQSFI